MTEVTKIAPALARGAEGKDSRNCRRSLELIAAGAKEAAKPVKVKPKAVAKPKAAKPVNATPASKLILKANKPIRAQLTEAAQSFGGTRLQPVGFDNYSAFLNGVSLDKDGNAEVSLVPVKGSSPIQGCNVKLTVKGGVPSVSKTGKPAK